MAELGEQLTAAVINLINSNDVFVDNRGGSTVYIIKKGGKIVSEIPVSKFDTKHDAFWYQMQVQINEQVVGNASWTTGKQISGYESAEKCRDFVDVLNALENKKTIAFERAPEIGSTQADALNFLQKLTENGGIGS